MRKKYLIYLIIFIVVCSLPFSIFIGYNYFNNKNIEYQNELNDNFDTLIKNVNIEEEMNMIYTAKKIPVITYHRIVEHDIKTKYFKNDEWVNDIDEIKKQFEYVYNAGWKTVDLDTFYLWMKKKIDLPEKTFVITIDDGDIGAYTLLLPLLKKYNFKATLFAVGSLIKQDTPEVNEPTRVRIGMNIVEELNNSDSLLKVESHSYNLHYVDKTTKKEVAFILSKNELVQDFKNNEKFNFKYMAYPYGAYTNDMLEAISESNIKMAFIFKKKNYATQDENIYEVSRLKVNGFTTIEQFKKIFDYVD